MWRAPVRRSIAPRRVEHPLEDQRADKQREEEHGCDDLDGEIDFRERPARSANAAARGFAKLLFQSLSSLAEKACSDPAFPDFAVFKGVSWLPAHGTRIGFVTTPLPDGLRKRLSQPRS